MYIFKRFITVIDLKNQLLTPKSDEVMQLDNYNGVILFWGISLDLLLCFKKNRYPATLGYEVGTLPIFKMCTKECIFERFSIRTKKSENMSF